MADPGIPDRPEPSPAWRPFAEDPAEGEVRMNIELEAAYHVALAEGRHMDALALRGEREA